MVHQPNPEQSGHVWPTLIKEKGKVGVFIKLSQGWSGISGQWGKDSLSKSHPAIAIPSLSFHWQISICMKMFSTLTII